MSSACKETWSSRIASAASVMSFDSNWQGYRLRFDLPPDRVGPSLLLRILALSLARRATLTGSLSQQCRPQQPAFRSQRRSWIRLPPLRPQYRRQESAATMDSPEPDTPFAAVTAQTTKYGRVCRSPRASASALHFHVLDAAETTRVQRLT